MKRVLINVLMIFFIYFMCSIESYAIVPSGELKYDGIDVSNWQGNIDFRKVKEQGIDIVYIKASEGTTFRDPYFDRNYEKAKENGLKVGFYHFLTATTNEGARNQAQFFASVISGKSPDCKLAMDFEQFNNNITRDEINSISKVFLETLERLTGKEVIVYSNLYDSQAIFDKEIANKYPLWLAYYGDYNKLVNVNSNWDSWDGVQYTSKGILNGISRIC